MSEGLNTPILLTIFNRLETTKLVFAEIKKVKPKKLFIAADGYRVDVKEEKEKCEKIRKYVLDNIDWKCEVKTLFRDKNLGCGQCPATAITWFFENVEEGIILEDDCLPSQSFFYFCEELLIRYRQNQKIFMISGDNFIPKSFNIINPSYSFSNIPHIWGWATWRRAWIKFDFNISDLPEFVDNKIIDSIWSDKKIKRYWLDLFWKVYKEDLDIWDYQWVYTIWKNHGVCINPSQNLVSNIGLNNNGTHTLCKFNRLVNIPNEEIKFPLKHPQNINISKKADNFINKHIFLKGSNLKYLKYFLKRLRLFNLSKKIYIKAQEYIN